MQRLLQQLEEWIRNILISGIMKNLTNTFESVNAQVGNIAAQVAQTPSNFSPGIFQLIRNLSENVIMPIAGILLTFIACYELIQMIISHNNLANFETWIFWKWIFKTFVAVSLVSNTMNITMAVFDLTAQVVNRSGGLIAGSTRINDAALRSMEYTIRSMDTGSLFVLLLQTFIVQFLIYVLSALIFVIIYARMIEIYMMVSLAPIPFASFTSREQGMMGMNYIRSLFAIGFQGFLIMVCVGIYAVLIQGVSFSSDVVGSLWGVMGYTILLALTLFKTGGIAKGILHAH